MRWWIIIAATGCSGSKTGDSGTGDTSTTSAQAATFSEVRDQVLVPNCAISSCHAAGDQNGMTLPPGGEYDALVNVESQTAPGNTFVVPGDSTNSYIVRKLQGDAGITGTPMPPPFGNLDQGLID